jgi:hypothetical protein
VKVAVAVVVILPVEVEDFAALSWINAVSRQPKVLNAFLLGRRAAPEHPS